MIFYFKEFCNLIDYLNMPDHTHQKWQYQLIENIGICLHAENQLYYPLLLKNITL